MIIKSYRGVYLRSVSTGGRCPAASAAPQAEPRAPRRVGPVRLGGRRQRVGSGYTLPRDGEDPVRRPPDPQTLSVVPVRGRFPAQEAPRRCEAI